jgi:hypothetical protein
MQLNNTITQQPLMAGSGPGQMPPVPPGIVPQWMNAPAPVAGCPPGLEYLTLVDQVLAHQVKLFMKLYLKKKSFQLKKIVFIYL